MDVRVRGGGGRRRRRNRVRNGRGGALRWAVRGAMATNDMRGLDDRRGGGGGDRREHDLDGMARGCASSWCSGAALVRPLNHRARRNRHQPAGVMPHRAEGAVREVSIQSAGVDLGGVVPLRHNGGLHDGPTGVGHACGAHVAAGLLRESGHRELDRDIGGRVGGVGVDELDVLCG